MANKYRIRTNSFSSGSHPRDIKNRTKYNFFSVKMKKNARKLITSLKKMDVEFTTSPLWNEDYDNSII
ncbi:hypothetical protein MTR_5g023400 [Medicago truncatula]|uniref:Uncharacterized protein n=1 Tax=Medicago truncatula TaxID=3880 RepID=G7JYV5_MEDTR|nr:hypothetical protein MTR_5g023400 [Medicago truncatula]